MMKLKVKNFKKIHIGEGLNRVELMTTVIPEQKIQKFHRLFQSNQTIQNLLFDWKPKGFISVKSENLLKFKEALANAQK